MQSSLFIDGEWRAASGGMTRDIECPADGSLVATVAEGCETDADNAITAARAAFERGEWAGLPAPQRGDFLLRVADTLVERKAEFARAESLDTGKRLVESEMDMDDIAACFRYYGKLAGQQAGRVVDAGDNAVTSRTV